MVMPEIGFDELPMRPVMREDTLTKKKPNRMVSTADQRVPLRRQARDGDQEDGQRERAEHARRSAAGPVRCARVPAAPPSPRPFMLSLKLPRMVGSVRPSVISPAASTAPAPM